MNKPLSLLALPVLALLGGCAGYAIDYVKPKSSILAPELTRYGLDRAQAECLSEQLGSTLSVWQMRQLSMRVASLQQARDGSAQLAPADILWAAGYVDDPKVAPEVMRTAERCGIGAAHVVAAAAPPTEPMMDEPAADEVPAAVRDARAKLILSPDGLWLNLGAASNGQEITVESASLREEGRYRSAWFRVINPDTGPSPVSYLVRIDCAEKTINPRASRRHEEGGGFSDERDFGPDGDGVMPIVPGTPMEVAHGSLCVPL